MYRFVMSILVGFFCLSCIKTQRFAGQFDFDLQNPQFLRKVPRQIVIELPKSEFWHNSFILKNGKNKIFCVTEVLSNYLDQSIKRIKIVWIAEDIEPFEKRSYKIYENIREREIKSGHPVASDHLKINELTDELSLEISNRGLCKLNILQNSYILQEKPLLINLKYQEQELNTTSSQFQIIEENSIYSEILIQNSINNVCYSCKYFVFNNLGLIFCISSIYLHKDDIYSLIEPFALKINGITDSAIEFYGWDRMATTLRDHEDYYDYLISEKPESYLFIKYRQNQLKKLQYNYVGNKAKTERENFFFTCKFDSIQICVVPGVESIHENAALHFATNTTEYHLSWHWHGFQSELHRKRIRRQRIKYYWPQNTESSFKTMLYINSEKAITENEITELRDYSVF